MFTEKKVIITGDFFRFKAGSGPNSELDQLSNIEWLYQVLSTPLTHLGYEVAQWPQSKYDREFIDLCRSFNIPSHLPANPTLWVSAYSRVHFTEFQLDAFKRIFADAIIIAFEAPDFLSNICKQCGIPLIEVIFHPVRYMPDLMLGIGISGQSNNDALAQYAVSDYELKQEASLLKATNCRLKNSSFLPDWQDVLLFTGQTMVDRSLIHDGMLVDLWTYRDKIADVFSGYDYVLYKPHPFMIKDMKNIAIIKDFFNSLGGAWELRVTSMDYYWLLSQGIISSNISISSGSTVEAKYFGVDSHFLAEYPWHLSPDESKPGETLFYPIMHDYFYPDFWATLLGHDAASSPAENYKMRYQPNRLRKSLLQAWGASRYGFGTEKKLYDIETANANEAMKNTTELAKQLANRKIEAETPESVAAEKIIVTKNKKGILRRKLPFLSSSERVAVVSNYILQAEKNPEYLVMIISELVAATPQLENAFKDILPDGISIIPDEQAHQLAYEKMKTIIQCSESFMTLNYYECESLKRMTWKD